MANAAVTFVAVPKQYVLARNAQVVYEPSVFAAAGTERRVNLVLDIHDDPRGHLKAIEESQVLGNALCSVIRDDGSVKLLWFALVVSVDGLMLYLLVVISFNLSGR